MNGEEVSTVCCRCGSTADAILEQPTIPQSLVYRMRNARGPKSATTAIHFHDTLEVLIRIMQRAAQKPDSGKVNVDSKIFKECIGLDEPCKEFFKHTRFTFTDQHFHSPEYTPDNIMFLNRCCFQLQLILLKEKPAALDNKPDARAKRVDLSQKSSLTDEHHSSFGKLGCVSDMNDDIIIDAFQTQLGHGTLACHPLMDTLVEIQKKRNSEQLDVEVVCKYSDGIVTTIQLQNAYRAFEIPNNGEGISTEVLLGLIRPFAHSGSRDSFRIIAKARKAPEIERLLEDPINDDQHDPSMYMYYSQNPVGLSNIGNTCYLNSLLQYIYTVNEIRETVLNMEAYVEDENEEGWSEKVIDGRILSRHDVAEAKEIVCELRDLFYLMRSAMARSVMPSSRLVELLLSTGNDGQKDANSTQKMIGFFEQQDVSETMSILMYRLNAAFRPIMAESGAKPVDRFNSIFYVKAIKKVQETNVSTGESEERLIPEDFNNLLLNVKEAVTLEELIDDYFDPDDDTEERTSRSSERKPITVTELPPILQIHLMRTQFDRDDKSSYKSNAAVSIPKRLLMDQYLEFNQEENMERIKRMKSWKKERRRCRKSLENIKMKREKHQSHVGTGPGLPIPNEFIMVQQTAPSGTTTPNGTVTSEGFELIEAGTDEQTAPGDDVASEDIDFNKMGAVLQVKIENLTKHLQEEEGQNTSQAEYKIHAVFHHEGNANFGHYWVYILDHQSEEPRWLKYSDDVVSEIALAQESEVFDGIEESTVCFCVYVRSDTPDAVQTVHRWLPE
ncbi:ubiquitin-specific protease ubp2 [Mortierella polycephala]|uniref:ubiquitinyl hydrolase 1 n=1 Tax=Mortierella polycephala TaxID=41804 RepID=A0A9P6Q159_9FUNG|nr:ubiquitin-specific protease ubp2 [Mortierella polycephala]